MSTPTLDPMRTLMTALLVLLLAVPAQASMVVVLATEHRVVAASDSRRMILDPTGREIGHEDDAIKLRVDGRFVMFGNGYIVLPGANEGRFLDPVGAWERLRPRPGESAGEVMDRLIAAVRSQRVEPPPEIDAGALVGVFGFRGPQPDGRIVRLRAVSGGPAEVTSDVSPWFARYAYVSSIDAAFADQMGAELTAAVRTQSTEAEMIALARAAIRRGAERIHSVGGPIHVVVVDTAGPRWIRGPLREE